MAQASKSIKVVGLEIKMKNIGSRWHMAIFLALEFVKYILVLDLEGWQFWSHGSCNDPLFLVPVVTVDSE